MKTAGKKELGVLSFSLIMKGVDGSGKWWLLRASTDGCQGLEAISALQGTVAIESTTEEAEQESWDPKDGLAQKKGFPPFR